MARRVEDHQAIRGADSADAAIFGVDNSIDAKNVVILDVRGASEARFQDVKAAIEVSGPKMPAAIYIERRDVVVRQYRARYFEGLFETRGGLLKQAAARKSIRPAIQRQQFLYFQHAGLLNAGSHSWRARSKRDRHYAFVHRSN